MTDKRSHCQWCHVGMALYVDALVRDTSRVMQRAVSSSQRCFSTDTGGQERKSFDWRMNRRYGGEGGILSKHPKKFSAAMVKPNSSVVNERKVEKRFSQC